MLVAVVYIMLYILCLTFHHSKTVWSGSILSHIRMSYILLFHLHIRCEERTLTMADQEINEFSGVLIAHHTHYTSPPLSSCICFAVTKRFVPLASYLFEINALAMSNEHRERQNLNLEFFFRCSTLWHIWCANEIHCLILNFPFSLLVFVFFCYSMQKLQTLVC